MKTVKHGHPRFYKLLESMGDTHRRKSAGYAGQDNPDTLANFRECEKLGVSSFTGCLVRMGDKWNRICNLAKDASNDQVGESITDTLIDLSSYSLIAIILLEEMISSDEKLPAAVKIEDEYHNSYGTKEISVKVKAGDRVRLIDDEKVYTVKSVWAQVGATDEIRLVGKKGWYIQNEVVIVDVSDIH